MLKKNTQFTQAKKFKKVKTFIWREHFKNKQGL